MSLQANSPVAATRRSATVAQLPVPAKVAERDDVKALTQESDTLELATKTYVVTTADQYAVAGADLQKVKGAQKRLETLQTSITRPMDAAKKAVLDLFRGPKAKLDAAERVIKAGMIGYSNEQDRIRREEQAKADAAARKQQEKLHQQAAKAIASGRVEKAVELETRAAMTVAPVIHTEPARVAGIATKEVWKFEITDPTLVPREYLMVDEKKVGGVVRAMKGDTAIAGVRVWAEKSLAAGSAA